MSEPKTDYGTVLKSSDETVVELIDGLFDLGQGHRQSSITMPWLLWKRLRRMIPAAEKVGPLPLFKEDAKMSEPTWVVVPAEPTKAMVEAGIKAATSERDHLAEEGVPEIYRAMLAAAPRGKMKNDQ